MNSSPHPDSSALAVRGPNLREASFGSRREVEDYLDRLNQASPVAKRQILGWGASEAARLHIGAVPMLAEPQEAPDIFLGEIHAGFGFDVVSARPLVAPSYSIGIVLAGAIHTERQDGEFVTRAGAGLIVDPAEIQRSHIEPGTHFVEFCLPKRSMLGLSAEWAPGSLAGPPRFAPELSAELAQRLLFMGRQTGAVLAQREGPGRPEVLFRRWMELISLTLLQERLISDAAPQHVGTAVAPASVRRALDFIEANAHRDIALADVASAACVSVSSMVRLFNRHIGRSPGAFLRDLRLDQAREALKRGTPESIRELALRAGFQSPAKFSQAYQRRFGERPSEARAGL